MFSQTLQAAIKAVIYIYTQSLVDKKSKRKRNARRLGTPEPFTAKNPSIFSKSRSYYH